MLEMLGDFTTAVPDSFRKEKLMWGIPSAASLPGT